MSRCFPFPPPGFQPKAWPDDVNLILKEKKEKKHKKHKDKDKKNRSKRKEKEGSSEGDHKKRKREDRDKKDRKKIKQISSDGEKNVGFLENQNGGELVTHSKPTDAIQNHGTFPKSGKTIRNDGGTPDNQTVHKITTVDKTERSKMANGQSFSVANVKPVINSADDKILPLLENGRTIHRTEDIKKLERVTHSKPTDAIQNQGTFPKSGKTIRNDGGTPDNQTVQKITTADKTERSKMANGQSFSVANVKPVINSADDKIHPLLENGRTIHRTEDIKKLELVTHSKPTDAIQNQGTFPISGKTIRNDGGTPDNQMVRKITTVDKTERSKMANGQIFNVDARRFENGNGEKRIKIEGGSCQVDKVEKGKDGNGRNGYGTVFGEGGGCKNGDQSKNTKAKEMNGYRNIFYEGNGCKNDDQNKNTGALDKEEKEKNAQGKKEKIIKGSSDCNFLISANKPSKLVNSSQGKLANHKELNGFSHGARPNNTSRPALSCPVEKGGIITNQKGIDKTSSPQSAINNVCQTPRNSAPEHVTVSINNHGLSNGPNGLNSSHLIIKKKTEPGPPTNTVANVKPVGNRADNKIHPLLENGRTIHMTEDTKKLRTDANVKPVVNRADNKIHPLLENGRTIHVTEDTKKLRTDGSVEGGKSSKASSANSTKSKKLKPPHPDLKYLNEILSVPGDVELPQCDDQDWLFGCKERRPILASSPSQFTKQVWAEAIQLNSVDITALPYVIPY